MPEYQYQHVVPQTYLKAWGRKNPLNPNPNNKDWVVIGYNKELNEFEENIALKNNFGINYFHSIVAAMPICSLDNCKKIFSILNDYNVIYNQKTLSITTYNENFMYFDQWQLYKNGVILSSDEKEKIFWQIKNTKINDVENKWSQKYECKWGKIREIIHQKVIKNEFIEEFYKGYLFKFIISMSFRGMKQNMTYSIIVSSYVDALMRLDEIEIPEAERLKPYLKTASDEVKNELLINYYRKFLNDDGLIYDLAKSDIKACSIIFLKSIGKISFATSDSPSFIPDIDLTKTLELTEIKLLMPISPTIVALCINRKSDKYVVREVSDDIVKKVNMEIFSKADKYVVVKNKQDLSK